MLSSQRFNGEERTWTRPRTVVLTTIGLLLLSCDSGNGVNQCEPNKDVFASNILPILDSKCSKCHGTVPQFGAPISLLTHRDLVQGDEGMRTVDLLIDHLEAGTMPPVAEPELTHAEIDTLAGWASCGTRHIDPASGLISSAREHVPSADPPLGTTEVELTAQNIPVHPDSLDVYREFEFSNVVSSEKFIRRIEPIVDDSRVLHHITLTFHPSGEYLYAWAPGGNPVDLGSGGLRINPSDEFKVQIHYNNGAGIPDVVDSSGVRIYLSNTSETEYTMLSPVTWQIVVPPQSEVDVEIDCIATSDFQLHLGMPHMHNIGSTFHTRIVRADGSQQDVNILNGWSFDAQRFYEYKDTQVNIGDHLKITCGYKNETNRVVRAGKGTDDEMCYEFIFASKNAAIDCNQE